MENVPGKMGPAFLKVNHKTLKKKSYFPFELQSLELLTTDVRRSPLSEDRVMGKRYIGPLRIAPAGLLYMEAAEEMIIGFTTKLDVKMPVNFKVRLLGIKKR